MSALLMCCDGVSRRGQPSHRNDDLIGKDYIYLHIPHSLEGKIWVRMTEDAEPVLDLDWMAKHKLSLKALALFFLDSELLKDSRDAETWESWILRFGDFTEEGQRFIMADYPGKWDAAWDRNPNKDPADVHYLEMRLRQLRKAMANP